MPEPWPTGPAAAVVLLVLVRDMDARSDQEDEALLAEFLCTAWPTHWAQRQ